MTYIRPRKLPNGIIVYPKRGWEPPPSIEGYTRQSNNPRRIGAWIFIPDWKHCKYREEHTVKRTNCGCETFVYSCNHPDFQGTQTTTAICEGCKYHE